MPDVYRRDVDGTDDDMSRLFGAGAEALRFNAPLGDERCDRLVGDLRRLGATSVVDLGCGRGELARMVASGLPEATVVGVDISIEAVEAARRLTTDAAIGDRVRFEVGDAATWSGAVDAAVCVGSSHAFGGPRQMFNRLADLVPGGGAVVGDGVWESTPTGWCRDNLGDHPDGPEALAAMAEAVGWTVDSSELSTQAEWDAFEGAWVAGVRSVGTAAAQAFADQREREYREHYRGVLGFCWLVLTC